MIVSKDTHPERKIYYWGALIIEVLKEFEYTEILFNDVFEVMKIRYKISIEVFILSLDWLFILNAIEVNDGKVIKCF